MSLLYLLGIPSLGTELQGCWRAGSGNKQTYSQHARKPQIFTLCWVIPISWLNYYLIECGGGVVGFVRIEIFKIYQPFAVVQVCQINNPSRKSSIREGVKKIDFF